MKNAQKSSKGFILPLLFIIIVLAVLGGLYGLVVWKWSYSDGERVGVVQKFSRKGWSAKRGKVS